jgi:hypothetical protein
MSFRDDETDERRGKFRLNVSKVDLPLLPPCNYTLPELGWSDQQESYALDWFNVGFVDHVDIVSGRAKGGVIHGT